MSRKPIAALTAAITLTAQAVPPVPQGGMELSKRGRYLAASDTFRREAFDTGGDIVDPGAFQMWAQTSPWITNELPLDAYDRRKGSAPNPEWPASYAGAIAHDAMAEIVARARRTSIVILNEAHVSPRDRAFALQVARALRPLGYTVLAAEAFNPAKMGVLERDGFARIDTGFYTRDPVYAGFVRQALALGYRPISYDADLSPNDRREEAAAANLMREIFTPHPEAKVLIYVGHSHVIESVTPGQTEWVASRIKRLTGIDPLTIDQTLVSDTNPFSRPSWNAAATRMSDKPAIFFKDGKPLVVRFDPGDVDLQVVHPRRAYRDGRPTWLATLRGKPVSVPANLLPKTGRRLVQAFAADAPADAVPLDQVLLTAGQPAPKLMVPRVKLRFATQDAP